MMNVIGWWQHIRKVYLRSFSDALMWFVLATMVLWIIAKLFGWMNTPPLLELYPVIGATIFGIKLLQKFTQLLVRFEFMGEDVKALKSDMRYVKEELRIHDKRLVRIEAKLS